MDAIQLTFRQWRYNARPSSQGTKKTKSAIFDDKVCDTVHKHSYWY